jgi:hypothetical protein
MNENQQQETVVENQTHSQESPESNTSDSTQSTTDMYNQAVRDINGLPILGRVALAVCIIIVLFKLTPVLDLIWLFLQIVVIPCLILISIGIISHETYMMVIGWLNESLVWAREKKEEIQKGAN